jgi:hypothetical protein
MVACGAFEAINRKVELIRGAILEMNPAGPVHVDLVTYLHEWSFRSALDTPRFLTKPVTLAWDTVNHEMRAPSASVT